jgi:protein-tyrosine-phosphatase
MTSKMISQAFIVGNGVSRETIDLHGLIGNGKIYGCNALYRDFSDFDYIVAIDDGMINELQNADINQKKVIIPSEDERWEDEKYSPMRRRSNAGMNAMSEAIKRHASKLYCLGFDFLLNGDISVKNVYDGSNNYGSETRAKIADNFYRVKYLEWFMKDNSHVDFVFVLPKDVNFVNIESVNAKGIYVDDFKAKFNC